MSNQSRIQNSKLDREFCSLLLLLPAVLITIVNGSIPHFDIKNTDVADGRRMYESAVVDSKLPKYGLCWKSALGKLDSYCKQLSDDKHHRLALYFTNCFLKKIGSPDYSFCEDNEVLSSCTSKMASTDRGIYTTFFTHTHNMCAFLQLTMWHELTEKTISNLAHSSENVAEQLSESAKVQNDIILKQKESLKNQDDIISSGSKLNKAIELSSVNIHTMFEEYKRTTQEQRLMISEVFDRVSGLQSLVIGEFSGFYSMIFYALSILICYALTSTPRTSRARIWMFVLMSVDFFVERLIVSMSNSDGTSQEINNINEELYVKLWFCRKVFSFFAISVLVYTAYSFKDMNVINNLLLLEIKKQNCELQQCLQSRKVGPDRYDKSVCIADKSCLKIKENGQGDACFLKKAISVNDSESESDTDSDITFMCGRLSDNDCSDNDSMCSFQTGCSFLGDDSRSLLDELRDIRVATPLHEVESEKKRIALDAEQIKNAEQPVHHYNLRRRSSDISYRPNPLIYRESPRRFAKAIKSLAKQAIRNRFEFSSTSYIIEETISHNDVF